MLTPLFQLYDILSPKSRLQFVYLLVVAIVAAGFQVVGVGSIIPFVALIADPKVVDTNEWIGSAYKSLAFTSFDSFVAAAGAFMVVAVVVSNCVNALAIWLSLKFAADAKTEMSHRLLRNYSCKPYAFFLNHNSSTLGRDVLQEIEGLQSYFITPLATCLVSSFTILSVLMALVLVDPIATLCAGLFFGGGYLITYLLCAKAQTRLGQTRVMADTVRFKLSAELLQGQREARLLNCRQFFLRGFAEATAKSAGATVRAGLLSQLPRQGLEVGAFAAVPLLVLYFLYTGRTIATFLPVLGVYAVAAVRLLPHLQLLFQALSSIRYSAVVISRLLPDLSYSTELPLIPAEPLSWQESIELDNLIFRYPDSDSDVLSGLNLTIPKNTSVAIVGATGAGKTTLINVLLGLLSPAEGQLKVDGAVMEGKSLDSWQAAIGFVPQDIYLADDSIASNIAFGCVKDEIDMERVREAARLSQFHDFVETLPDGYKTLVGERGVRLSGGQRQRLGIARSLYRQPTVLILDEATSALDGLTEQAVMDAVGNLRHSKTVILVAHRLTTVRECAQVFMLERGKFVDHGTYDELMDRNQTFRAFARAPS